MLATGRPAFGANQEMKVDSLVKIASESAIDSIAVGLSGVNWSRIKQAFLDMPGFAKAVLAP